MLKKRIIFTLLYSNGSFMLSRNFRLQRIGDLGWIQRHYDFSQISHAIDELVVLDVTRENRDLEVFCGVLKSLTYGNFIPITAGGGVKDIDSARTLLRSGADKITINSSLFEESSLAKSLAEEFGEQCVVASIDVKRSKSGDYQVCTHNGEVTQAISVEKLFRDLLNENVGELYLNSVDRDGTGQGLDVAILDLLPAEFKKPVILAGGVGNADHLLLGLKDQRLDAVATANLLNFVGDGLSKARQAITSSGIVLPMWNPDFFFSRSKIGQEK